MACVLPLDCWRSSKLNPSGKRGITFNLRDAYTDQPLTVPCGKCTGCRIDRSIVWSIRMHHESTMHLQNSFVTLTYDEANHPPDGAINKRHLQLFIKRLRKQYQFRYFAVGEYGGNTRRPHYHLVIFGQDFRGGEFKINDQLYGNPFVQRAWGQGIVSIGSVTLESCMYVAGYSNKKAGDPDTFNLMSRMPGIGHTWLDKYKDDILRTGQVVINGKTMVIPLRYMQWFEKDFEKIKNERRQYIQNLTPDQRIKKRESLKSVEINYKARLKLKGEQL